jgi:hypothetical protein
MSKENFFKVFVLEITVNRFNNSLLRLGNTVNILITDWKNISVKALAWESRLGFLEDVCKPHLDVGCMQLTGHIICTYPSYKVAHSI